MKENISFQFLNGSIKRTKGLHEFYLIANFNSLMVRLKESPTADILTAIIPFQFLNGSIKSQHNLTPTWVQEISIP